MIGMAPPDWRSVKLADTSSGLVRWASAGGVDDGKSTLIGRLLFELGALPEDQLETLDGDFARVTDGLRAEREQGITIDVAYRYFESSNRKYLLADTPGHDRFQRNTVSGICEVDLVVVLVDARKGITEETERHLALCRSVQVPKVVLAANKMDLVDDPESAYRQLQAVFEGQVIPVCALTGDNLVHRGELMPWYNGPTLFEMLESIPVRSKSSLSLRVRVQGVLPEGQGVTGLVSSGEVRLGDRVAILPSRRLATVQRLFSAGDEVERAGEGEAVALQLDQDCQRGDLIVDPAAPPRRSRHLRVSLSLLSERGLDESHVYLALCGQRRFEARWKAPHGLELSSELDFDTYQESRAMGSLILVDPESHDTVAAGTILGASWRPFVLWFTGLSGAGKSTLAQAVLDHYRGEGRACLWLDGDRLREGVNRDLDFSPQGRAENLRRVAELAKLAHEQGLLVICSFISPFALDRANVRSVVGSENLWEVYLQCSLAECQRRDPKGLYRRAQRAEVANFTGISSAYEVPEQPDVILDTEVNSIASCVSLLLERLDSY